MPPGGDPFRAERPWLKVCSPTGARNTLLSNELSIS